MSAINRSEGHAMDLGDYDALVVGGGLSGWAAAVALARSGAQVLLAAERTALGHEVWGALSLWPGDDGALPTSPLTQDILDGLSEVNAVSRGALDPVATQVLLERLASDAGVKLLLQVWCHWRGSGQVILTGKWGTMAASASVFVDSTRGGNLALEAGASAATRQSEERPLRRALVINTKCEADTEFEVGDGLPLVGGKVRARCGVWPGDVILEASLDLDAADPAQFELESRGALIEAAGRLREQVPAFEVASLIMVAHDTIMPRSEVIVGADDDATATQLATESGASLVKRGALLPGDTENLVLASPAAELDEVSAAECCQMINALRIGEAAGEIAQQLLEA